MLTINMLCDIKKLKRESRLQETLVEFLEKMFRELHEGLESEVDFDHFSLQMYGPIYVLQAVLDNPTSLRTLGLFVQAEVKSVKWSLKLINTQ